MPTIADTLLDAIACAPRDKLDAIVKAVWDAYNATHITEAEATILDAAIQARTAVATVAPREPRRGGSRPRSDASQERRRRWAASGRLPPPLAARFTLAEQAVLAVVAAESVKRGDCRLPLDHLAAVAGVSRSTAKTALRQAARLGLLTIEERRLTRWRNQSNIVRIISPEWLAWMRHARRADRGGGVNSSPATSTGIHILGVERPGNTRRKATEREKRLPPDPIGGPRRSGTS